MSVGCVASVCFAILDAVLSDVMMRSCAIILGKLTHFGRTVNSQLDVFVLEVSNCFRFERQVLFCDLLVVGGLRSRLCYSIGCFVFSREGTIVSMDDNRRVFVAVAGLEFFLACVTVADVQTFETVDFRFRYFGMISTWLILPVVIRLSQRLSHACLSISNFVL